MMVQQINRSADACRLVEGAMPAQLIACESTGRWAVALRRELPDAVAVRETRSVAECWETLAAGPAGFVVFEATEGNVDAFLRRMAWFERDFPLARIAVVAARTMARHEALFREAGAIVFITSPRRLGPLASLACRHLAHAPRRPQNLADRIWEELPWRRFGGGRHEST